MAKNPTPGSDDAAPLETATLLALFATFFKIGMSSFGGSSRAQMYSEAVEKKRWLRDKDFLTGFAVAQVLPGANPVNLALYIGLHARGRIGAVAAVLGMVVPAFCIILLMGYAYRQLSGHPETHFVLAGVAAAGVGATLAVGVKVATRVERHIVPVVVALAVFGTVGVFHWPMIPVVVVAVPLSIAVAFWKRKNQSHV
jgi:chromate transporter